MIFTAAVLQILLQRLFLLAQQYFLYLVQCFHLHFSEVSFHLRSYLFKIIVSFSFLCKTCPPLTTFEFRRSNIFWRLLQSNVHFFTIDFEPHRSVLNLFTFGWYVDDDLVVWFSGNLEGWNLSLKLPGAFSFIVFYKLDILNHDEVLYF